MTQRQPQREQTGAVIQKEYLAGSYLPKLGLRRCADRKSRGDFKRRCRLARASVTYDFALTDGILPAPNTASTYYYMRLCQHNAHRAWLSPVWLDRP